MCASDSPKVEPNFVKAEILAVCDAEEGSKSHILKTTFQGIIFKENARAFDHEGVDLYQCFRPNDIIRASVIMEQGGGKESSTQLSTASDDCLGVIFARCEETGMLMVPRSFHSSQCPESGIRERRKNAKPPSNVLQAPVLD
ncbi:hypothetical protein FGO68_gene10794 [Halteria grandinella]|uniref:Exosome complex component CSL4 C-terminal domain-containing protein n=1 Tax=Halteria grandinella TaxID=5974 RepID=A0A8J8NIC7_HALGN|nr:hypothetical protein FGO68_gene10794 [Halteria grandinella]